MCINNLCRITHLILQKHNVSVKKLPAFLVALIAFCFTAKAQKIDSIYFNLYTDSLKKGSLHYNYINVDGKLSNGSYLPLDSTHVIFMSSVGKMKGNVLTLDSAEMSEFVLITASLRSDPAIKKEVKIYIKKVMNDELLKTEEELIGGWQRNSKKKN